ncbi:hypothetical protein MSG28_007714 [Choristoneura fumiferana]|uniref:Uncharacterized protein n=1 Tax=Choristoneura fumiferana TaxID=7141 RepID=A0ACC0JYA8_CHOFU|nr:hypothetical protein MSG28_007714 [Choristoneura fumiferana]
MAFKSKKIVKKQQQNTEPTILPLRQRNLELEAIGPVPPSQNVVFSEKELNNSNYDSWYSWRQGHQEGNKLISLEKIAQQPKFQQKSGTASEQSTNFLQLQVDSRPPDITKKYRETVQKPNRKKGKPRYPERKERTETRRCIELNKTKSVESTENSTLREEYINYDKNKVVRQAAEIKSSLALNIECNDNNSLLWRQSQPETRQHEMGINYDQIRKKEHVLKRCSCELKLYCNQSESESMIINVLNPTKENVSSELLSSLFESNDFIAKRNRREDTSIKTDLNDFTSISVMRAISKEAQTCLNIKEDEYISASIQDITSPKHARDNNKYDEEEPRLSVLYVKDLATRPKNLTQPNERAIKSSSEKCNSLKMTTACRKDKLDKRKLKESAQNKINKPHNEQAFEETYPCYRYVDCKPTGKEKKSKIKRLDLHNESKVKCTQTPPKVKKPKCTKAAVKTAVKALQVTSSCDVI